MMTLSLLVAFGVRCLLVILFLPFSAADKILNFSGAVGQASEIAPSRGLARGLILVGLFIEIVMSLGVVSGIADRLAAFVLAGYCMTTALLWKQFWKPGDFWAGGKGRELFWDFLKNISLGAGFLLVTFGTGATTVQDFLMNPAASSNPYRLEAPAPLDVTDNADRELPGTAVVSSLEPCLDHRFHQGPGSSMASAHWNSAASPIMQS